MITNQIKVDTTSDYEKGPGHCSTKIGFQCPKIYFRIPEREHIKLGIIPSFRILKILFDLMLSGPVLLHDLEHVFLRKIPL